MKNFFQRLFQKKSLPDTPSKLKQFSSTLTTTKEGTSAKWKLNPSIANLVHQLKNGKQIDNSQLNQLSSFYFDTPPIVNTYYKFNPAMQPGMVFEITCIDTITNEVNDVVIIKLTMHELIYNIDLTIKIDIREFHEFLVPI